MNEYLRPLYESIPADWTPTSELGEWTHLDELWQDGLIECKIESLGEHSGTVHYYRRLTPKERELRERVKATERLERYYVPWAEQWREEHGDEPVPSDMAAQWVEKAKHLQAQKPGAYYTPARVYDGVQGSGGFLATMGNPPYGDSDG